MSALVQESYSAGRSPFHSEKQVPETAIPGHINSKQCMSTAELQYQQTQVRRVIQYSHSSESFPQTVQPPRWMLQRWPSQLVTADIQIAILVKILRSYTH